MQVLKEKSLYSLVALSTIDEGGVAKSVATPIGAMSMEKEIRKKLLEKMLRGEYIGKRYMSYDDAHKGFPSDLAGRVRKVVRELLKDGLIIIPEKKPFTAISLNPKRISEIAEIIRDP